MQFVTATGAGGRRLARARRGRRGARTGRWAPRERPTASTPARCWPGAARRAAAALLADLAGIAARDGSGDRRSSSVVHVDRRPRGRRRGRDVLPRLRARPRPGARVARRRGGHRRGGASDRRAGLVVLERRAVGRERRSRCRLARAARRRDPRLRMGAPPGCRGRRARRAPPPGARAPRRARPGARLHHDGEPPARRASRRRAPGRGGRARARGVARRDPRADATRPTSRSSGRSRWRRRASACARASTSPSRFGPVSTFRPRYARRCCASCARRWATRPATAARARSACRSTARRRWSWRSPTTGAGFDLAAARRPDSLGLQSMEERAFNLGGRLSIESVPGQGTTVAVVLP